MYCLNSISDLSISDVHKIFDIADTDINNTYCDILKHKTVLNIFLEQSTRTAISFEIATKKLSANVINFNSENSSIKKGENLYDTLNTLMAYNSDYCVIRSPYSGIFNTTLSKFSDTKNTIFVNAGDGMNEHPTQALIDLYTIYKYSNIDLSNLSSLKDLKIAICGDILHSRVAHSNIKILSLLGIKPILIGPLPLVSDYSDDFQVYFSIDEALKLHKLDFLMILRVQFERTHNHYINSKSEYAKFWGINAKKIENSLNPDMKIMHPGPVNRRVEISEDVFDLYSKNILILDQVRLSIKIRQAVFIFLEMKNFS